MKNYYNVSFKYSESVYCSNIAHAESVEDVERHYNRYPWVKVTEASEHDVKNALERGEPVIEVEHIETAEETEPTEEVTVKTVNPVLDALEVLDRVQTALDTRKDRSAWNKGVTVYAAELLEGLRESIEGGYFDPEDLAAPKLLNRELLNGADDWNQYSWGGSSLIYDGDIARRLCTPSELRRTREGERRPNAREEWLDTQARALFQAAHRLTRTIRDNL